MELGGERENAEQLAETRRGITRMQFVFGTIAALGVGGGGLLQRMFGRRLEEQDAEVQQKNALIARAVESLHGNLKGSKIVVLVPDLNKGVEGHLFNPKKTDAFKGNQNYLYIIREPKPKGTRV